MGTDVSRAFIALLAGNEGPDPDHPSQKRPAEYGVAATMKDGTIRARLTFLDGASYCCFEPGCHVGVLSGGGWEGLRGELARLGIEVPDRLRIHLRGVVEKGARSFDFTRPDRRVRGRYAFRAVETAWSWQVQRTEAGNRRTPPADG